MSKVTYSESLPIRIAKFLEWRGVQTLPRRGKSKSEGLIEVDEPFDETARQGFALYDFRAPPPGWMRSLFNSLMGVVDPDPYSFTVGTLWIEWPYLEAEPSKKWVLLIYGRQNVGWVRKIVEDMAEEFNIEIHIKLRTEHRIARAPYLVPHERIRANIWKEY